MSIVSIKPYIRPEIGNHGLTKHGLVVAPSCEHGQWLRCIDNGNGVKTYITGLNEGAKEVQELPEEQRNAKILDIRKTVVMAENQIAGNYSISEDDIYHIVKRKVKVSDPEDGRKKIEQEVEVKEFNPKFWSLVTKFRSVIPDEFEDGVRKQTYWDTMQLICSNIPRVIDTAVPQNVLLIKAIEAGGFGDLLAPSLEVANNYPGNSPYKFYLDRLEQSAAVEVADEMTRNKAGAMLEHINDTDQEKMFYIVKNLAQFSLGYRRATPYAVLYGDINKYIDGKGTEPNKKVAIKNFMELCDTKKYKAGDLRLRAICKDAVAMNIIAPKGDGVLYHIRKGNPMGKNFEDIVMYLNNPLNSDVLLDVTADVEKIWNGK